MSQRSRIRYDKRLWERVLVLPAGMADAIAQSSGGAPYGELFPDVCREVETIWPTGEIDIETACDRGVFCPICGKRVELEERTKIEFRGKCAGCKKFLITMFYSPSTVTVKWYHPR